ncbi:helix-turn-helix domain-containing protein [Methylobacterium sp. E-025]|uniref:helix-turn-helix domain-containing protein n=1 Tax=Methylobacterium sp. E-025 TaxID=2836561 RepID=UPI001FB9D9E3|nr:helix-turn-helix domain-containing protein [Methylobacterium sp. E-025]MCJ2112751.1 helix-turn-helix domain-containing protein [Methylobacterium sp. E-025]
MVGRQIWHAQDVIAEIRKSGTSLAALSRLNGFADRSLRTALTKRWPRANSIIASHLNVSRHQIWPHWFGPNDELLPLSKRPSTRKAA